MARPLKKFNPAFLSKQDLIRSFVIRQIELDILLETIRTNTYESNQNILIIGPCGMGKTHLMLRAAAAVQDDEVFKNRWYPIVFGEESYEVFTAGQFWLEALGHLAEQRKEALGEDRWEQIYDRLRDEQDEQRLHDQALARILDFADGQKKRLLLIVENFNLILGDQMSDDEGWLIRRTLLNEPRIMLLATATSRFDEIDNVQKPMYELFKIHTLEPLDEEACGRLLASIGGRKLKAERVRQIQILTGGNPRFLAIIASFASNTSFRELMDDLTDLIDDHTDYFKTNIEKLPALERKVFVTLANIWNPAASREVAKEARINVNKASSLLKRLTERGAVEIRGKGRRQKYQVAERLYNIYYLMRRHGGKSSRVRATVDFMLHFYEGEELVKVTASIAEEACKLEPDLRQEHYVAYEEILSLMEPSKVKKILKKTNPQFFSLKDVPQSILEKSYKYNASESHIKEKIEIIMPSDEIKQISEEEIRSRLNEDPENPIHWLELGQLLHNRNERKEEAEQAFRKAIQLKPSYTWAWALLGLHLQMNCKRFIEAESAFQKAIELDPDVFIGWALQGFLFHFNLERYKEAEKMYRKAVELIPEFAFVWHAHGLLCHENLGIYNQAELSYRKAITLESENAWAWCNLGRLLHEKLYRYEEAEQAYRKALKIEPDHTWSLAQLGKLLHENLERYDEAEKVYKKAIETAPENAWVWVQLGQLLNEKLEHHEEAEKSYRKAIEIIPNYAYAWAHLGSLLYENLGDYDEAEKAYIKAIEIKPDYAWAWAHLGILLHEIFARYEEAERAYRKAVELEPDVAKGWVLLGNLHKKLGRYEEAEKAYQKTIELKPENATGWVLFGLLLHENLCRYKEAEQAYRKAIQIKPQYDFVWISLVKLQLIEMKHKEAAFDTVDQYLKMNEQNATSLNKLAWIFYKSGWKEHFSEAEAWAREAVEKESDNSTYQFTLASILGGLSRWPEALDFATRFLSDSDLTKKNLTNVINLFIGIAAAGHAQGSLRILMESASAPLVEPLIIAFQMEIGEEHNAPKEIEEVAKDICKRIEGIRTNAG